MKIKYIIKLKLILCFFANGLFAQHESAFQCWHYPKGVIKKSQHHQVIKWAIKQSKNVILGLQIPCISPLMPDKERPISSTFGWRKHPLTGKIHFHKAVDIAGIAQDIYATASGVVKEAAYSRRLGLYVCIDHQNGYQTIYGHLKNLNVVQSQAIAIGEKLGEIGRTGWATGHHLHYGVSKNGCYIDPLSVIGLLNHCY